MGTECCSGDAERQILCANRAPQHVSRKVFQQQLLACFWRPSLLGWRPPLVLGLGGRPSLLVTQKKIVFSSMTSTLASFESSIYHLLLGPRQSAAFSSTKPPAFGALLACSGEAAGLAPSLSRAKFHVEVLLHMLCLPLMEVLHPWDNPSFATSTGY